MKTFLGSCLALVVLTACSGEQAQPVFHADTNPDTLSAWGQVTIADGTLALSENVMPYDLNTPLFSDYAHKLRTVWLPDGTKAAYREGEVLDFPVGTVITKTFYYETPEGDFEGLVLKSDGPDGLPENKLTLENVRLIETRVLARRESGWVALPYVWNDDQTDAMLQRAGEIKRLTLVRDAAMEDAAEFAYLVPDVNQCAGCHATNATTRAIQPIGPKARHLNGPFVYDSGAENQLVHWQSAGLLESAPAPHNAPRNAVWTDTSKSLDRRARAYLDANCAHCHNTVGAADTSGLHLEPDDPYGPNLGICKTPIAAGTGTGGRHFDIVPGDPDASIFTYRMASTNPAEMMPELGRSLAHDEGVELIVAWIESLEGGCTSDL
ncbi:SO2930 family diheme c-type cytochrome [Parvularcula sp. IMCC14364]|uniref:SO2930 family diheme c-type cytochrome n=1 Tax=Parvularcula sp. IMCC14364 TaxID=3067902 RepID=UPI00274118C8|nr:SO2930 family diheme c-type cytochrome [Parvularcula sp. IMCC14364]